MGIFSRRDQHGFDKDGYRRDGRNINGHRRIEESNGQDFSSGAGTIKPLNTPKFEYSKNKKLADTINTKGYEPNPNSGLYDNKKFKLGGSHFDDPLAREDFEISFYSNEVYDKAVEAKIERGNNSIKIDGQNVIKMWESFQGWYWYAIEDQGEYTTVDDTIAHAWYGYVQGNYNEWGTWDSKELERAGVWTVPKSNWGYSGRSEESKVSEDFDEYGRDINGDGKHIRSICTKCLESFKTAEQVDEHRRKHPTHLIKFVHDTNGDGKYQFNESTYDEYGHDKNGFDEYGYDWNGYNKNGYDKNGYDEYGYNWDGYDKNGYDWNGLDKYGHDVNGYDKYGRDKYGYDKDGYNKDGYYAGNKRGESKES